MKDQPGLKLQRESCDPLARAILDRAETFAIETGRYQVFPEHLMRATVLESHEIRQVLFAVGVCSESLVRELESRTAKGTDDPARPVPISPRSQRAMNAAYDRCFQHRKGVRVSAIDLLHGLVDDQESVPGNLWASFGVDRKVLERELEIAALRQLAAPPVLGPLPGESVKEPELFVKVLGIVVLVGLAMTCFVSSMVNLFR
jgi:ATP-dependent Clp protease ATP-binding subunit ClpA